MSKNLVWHEGKVSHQDRCRLMGQEGMVVWFTGLSGSGKSTIAAELELKLIRRGRFVYRLDGDNVRHGLNSDLGFSPEDRDENIRRVAEVAALFKDAGFIVLVSFISPYRAMREFARSKAGENFIEVYVQAGLETCQRRDPKSLYKKAAAGELSEFTGISSPYEEPEYPEIVLDTDELSIEAAVDKVLSVVLKRLETD